MRNNIIGYSTFLVISLALAFYISLPGDNRSSSGQSWIDIEPSSIEAITYQTKDKKIVATRLDKLNGFWIDMSLKSESKGEESDKTMTTEHAFKASSKIDAFTNFLSPVYAIRLIGDVDKVDKAEFGFDDESPLLSVAYGNDKSFKLLIGKKSYGSRNRFALDSDRNKIILVSGRSLETFSGAKLKMFERDLLAYKSDDIVKASITAGGINASWDHTSRDSTGKLQWKDAASDKKADPRYGTWISKLLKLKVMEYANQELHGQLDAAQPFLNIDFGTRNDSSSIIFKRRIDNDTVSYWVLSSYLGRYARVNTDKAAAIEKDIVSLVGKS